MQKKLIVVYDNTTIPSEHFRDIIGDSSFADVIYSRKTFRKRAYDVLTSCSCVEQIVPIEHALYFEKVTQQLKSLGNDYAVMHLYSYAGIRDSEEFSILAQKLAYAAGNTYYMGNRVLFYAFSNVEEYINKFSALYQSGLSCFDKEQKDFDLIHADCFFDFSLYQEFLKYISGGFQARYFNSLVADDDIVTKRSADKLKMKKEYTYYYLLPPEMQMWCVLPFRYQELTEYASYSMERYGVTDMAIKWVHQSITLDEFDSFLKKAFSFILARPRKKISATEYAKVQDDLYLKKVRERIELLKKHSRFPELNQYFAHIEQYTDIDALCLDYFRLYQKIQAAGSHEPTLAVGHGDFCFSNILYDKQTRLMRLIDPKGALEEKDLWTDPYYDIAKLSHSICGLYDFFNSDLYDISINSEIKIGLSIDVHKDMKQYAGLFQQILESNGFSYAQTRLYEASLFLSMLPLHMDNPRKVLGFLLNAIQILKDLDSFVENK